MATLTEWMAAYQSVDGKTIASLTNCRVPPELVFAFANGDEARWRTLVGCQIRLLGRGFGEVIRVEKLTLWVQFDNTLTDKSTNTDALQAVNVAKLEGSRITGVLFPAGFEHLLVYVAMLVNGEEIPGEVAPGASTLSTKLHREATELWEIGAATLPPVKKVKNDAKPPPVAPVTVNVSGTQSEQAKYVSAAAIYAWAGNDSARWQTVVGYRIHLPGRGFGDIMLVENLTLWVLFDLPREERFSKPPELESVPVQRFENGVVGGVIFPPDSDHPAAHIAKHLPKKKAPPKPISIPEAPVVSHPPQKARAKAISEFCQARGIECLLHFTRAENIEHIIKYGLVNRIQVDQWRKENNQSFPFICDEVRLDGKLDAICLSISFPNCQLFYAQQKKHGGKWAVIRLRAAILWELECAFCHTNAASSIVKYSDIHQRKSVEALQGMFWNTADDLRAQRKLPAHYTTNPQAEVLVLEQIPTKYIEMVYFEGVPPMPGWQRKGGGHVIHTVTEERVFEPRLDYLHWQKEKPPYAGEVAASSARI